MRFTLSAAVCAFVVASLPAHASDLVGRATVIDGDTLEIHGERIRIEGIDAPESRQTCHDRTIAEDVRCGQRAALWLSDLLGARTVTCKEAGKDRYKRMLAHCAVAGQDVGAAMVEAGWAMAYVRYSREYEAQGAKARDARLGIWQWDFVAPWDWRRGAR